MRIGTDYLGIPLACFLCGSPDVQMDVADQRYFDCDCRAVRVLHLHCPRTAPVRWLRWVWKPPRLRYLPNPRGEYLPPVEHWIVDDSALSITPVPMEVVRAHEKPLPAVLVEATQGMR